MTEATRYRVLRGTRAAVVAGHPAAVAAGARVLDRGGNAIDAAIAAAAVMTVARPHMCGLGGDGFLLVYHAGTRRVHALNAGGPAPKGATPDRFGGAIPDRGPLPTTVPGVVDGWGQALDRFGSMPWSELLAPAVELAERGLPVYESLALWFRHYQKKYLADPGCARVLFPDGRPLRPGEILVQRDLARSLAGLAERGPREFYEGQLACRYVDFMRQAGGLVTAEDLAGYRATWTDPLTATYRDHVVHSQPPMSQGWMLIQMLAALDGVSLRAFGSRSGALAVRLVNAVRAAFADRQRRFGDPRFVPFAVEDVLAPGRIAEIRGGLDAIDVAPVSGGREGDTTTLSVVDRDGNAVSLIQSLWIDAGVMVPGTGILLNSRLTSATLAEGHPDRIDGGKYPAYTLHTFMATRRDGTLAIVGGTPGGQGQVQTNLQVLTSILDFELNAQEAVEAPRFVVGGAMRFDASTTVFLEGRFPAETAATLSSRGVDVVRLPDWAQLELEGQTPITVGSAKLITIDAAGVRTVGVDPRREAHGLVC